MNKKPRISEKLRKKYGACEHNKVSYKAMEKIVNLAYKRSKEDAKTMRYLSHRLKQDAWFYEGSPGYGKILINDVRIKNERIKKLETINKMLMTRIANYEAANKEFSDQNEELRERLSFDRKYDKYIKPKKKN